MLRLEAALVLLLALPVTADVLNPGFDTRVPATGSPRGLSLKAGDNALSPWQVQAGTVYWLSWPHCPSHAVELAPGSTLCQGVDTTPGTAYELRFLFYTNYHAPSLKAVSVSAGDAHASFSDDSSKALPGAHTWVEEHWVFTAAQAQTALTWQAVSAPGDGPYLADVSLQPYDPAREDEVDIRRLYVRYLRGIREQDAPAIERLQTIRYQYRTFEGQTMDRLAFDVALRDALTGAPDAHDEIVSVKKVGDTMRVVVDEDMEYTLDGHRFKSAGREVDIWMRQGPDWRIMLSKELKKARLYRDGKPYQVPSPTPYQSGTPSR